MKKALSLVIALLMTFSMFGVMASAAEDDTAPIKIIFIVDGNVVKEISVQEGTILTQYAPEDPVKPDTDTTRYIFKGWQTEGDDNLYYQATFPVATLNGAETREIIYTAVFSEQDLSGRQSLWNFIESLFERLNLLFEYFATVFNW